MSDEHKPGKLNELTNEMKQAFEKKNMKPDAKQNMDETCGSCHSIECKAGCDKGCLESCKTGTK